MYAAYQLGVAAPGTLSTLTSVSLAVAYTGYPVSLVSAVPFVAAIIAQIASAIQLARGFGGWTVTAAEVVTITSTQQVWNELGPHPNQLEAMTVVYR
jgi:hypothetical protein